MSTNDFDTVHLKGRSKSIANSIVKFMSARFGRELDGGGCKAFYSPQEWKERGESYGTNSLLVICHDGGDLYEYLSYIGEGASGKTREELDKMLASKHKCYIEACTGWYSAVYPI